MVSAANAAKAASQTAQNGADGQCCGPSHISAIVYLVHLFSLSIAVI